MKGVYRELIAALSCPPPTPIVPLCFEPTFSLLSPIPSLRLLFLLLPGLSRSAGEGPLEKGVLGSVANTVKALRIPDSGGGSSQPAVPHGEILASKPQIFPVFFTSLPLLQLTSPRWDFQRAPNV